MANKVLKRARMRERDPKKSSGVEGSGTTLTLL